MFNQTPIKKFDLEERTAKFGENSIKFARKIPQTALNLPVVTQFIRASTSVGANYCEADDAESRTDFKHKIGICKKEARETGYWLRMMATIEPSLRNEIKVLWKEAKELNLIFNAIIKSTKANSIN